jgi:hypothetical protein
MAVPNIFASATSAIPLSQLDQNFATAITLGNTAVYLGNTTTSFGNVTLTNVTISSGNVTVTGANVSGTANVSTLIVTGNTTLGDASADTVTVNGTTTFNASPIISVTDNTNAALRITQLGTGNALLVEDSTNPDSSPLVIDNNGRLVVGATQAYSTTTGGVPTFTPVVQLNNASANTPSVGYLAANWATATGAGSLTFAKSRGGVIGTHSIASSGDDLGVVYFMGSDGTAFIPAASITSAVDGTPGTSDMPGRLEFSTTADGASTLTERMRITSAGNVLVTNAAGLGYGTGAGGTVTQATSRTTGVTLSKPTGAITMFSAAGSATAATFTVTNTLVAATDTIILNQKSGTNLYVLLVTAVAAGSFNITFYTTGGTATDAPVINFALIKGVTA